MTQRTRRRSKRPACAIRKVWGYPPPADEMRPTDPELVHYAWACRCGKHGSGYPTKEAAQAAAIEHFDLAAT